MHVYIAYILMPTYIYFYINSCVYMHVQYHNAVDCDVFVNLIADILDTSFSCIYIRITNTHC